MIIDDITLDDVITVLEHVQATCACNDDYCLRCPYAVPGYYNACALSHLPELWQLDKIGGYHNED